MRILWSWLQELVSIQESPEAVAQRLTRAGLEVEEIRFYRRLPEALKGIFVGEVRRLTPHPAADKLFIAEVMISPERQLTIVTGATNLTEGARVPVALPGSQIYREGRWISIEERSLRGILSEGMLCSEAELNIGNDTSGIYLLPPNAPLGRPLTEVLPDYTDIILEVNATPNRGDALSHLGIAREYAVLTGARWSLPSWRITGERRPFPLAIEVPDTAACPRYGGIYVWDIEPGKASPDWMRFRLEAAGLRSIHPVVDVTNYILIGYGQPLHAFDGAKLVGRRLRIAPLTEKTFLRGLGGQELLLEEGDLLISDDEGPACLAGVLGGERTAISSETQETFIESAYFSPTYIRRTGRRLGLHTESGYRFMRGTDPDRVPWAAEAAAALLQTIYPSAVVSLYHEVHEQRHTIPYRFTIHLPALRRQTGLSLPSQEVHEILQRLDISIDPVSEEVWTVSVPRYRLDVMRPADIAEELLRIIGWEKLPSIPQPPAPYPKRSETDTAFELRHILSEVLTGMGFWEIRTNSLVGQHHFLPDSPYRPIRLANPLYEELAYLRPTLLGSGLEVLVHNRNHGAVGFWTFEWGHIYHAEGEELRLGLWGWGRPPARFLTQQASPLEYLLTAIRALLQRTGITFSEKPFSTQGVWREGIRFYAGETLLGEAGYITATYLKSFRLKGEVVAAAELNPKAFLSVPPRRLPYFMGISYQPVVIKDLSLYVPDGLTYADLMEALLAMKHPYLRHIEPFDRYTDAQGRRSYGIRLYLQGEATLTEEEIHEFLRKAVAAVEKLGAQVRKAETSL